MEKSLKKKKFFNFLKKGIGVRVVSALLAHALVLLRLPKGCGSSTVVVAEMSKCHQHHPAKVVRGLCGKRKTNEKTCLC